MKMKKLITIALCIMLAAGLLLSCRNGNDPASPTDDGTESSTVALRPEEWTLIRPQKASPALTAEINRLKRAWESATGETIVLKTDADPEGTHEILIGETSRAASKSARDALQGDRYALVHDGNHIVIVGSCDALTAEGVRYFAETYVAGAPALTLPDGLQYVSEELDVVSLTNGTRFRYPVIFADGLDNTPDKGNQNRVDYTVQLARDLRNRLEALTGAVPNLKSDWVKIGTDTAGTYEILIGDTARPESAQAKSRLRGAQDYGVFFIGNKIVISAWTEQTLGKAVNLFLENLELWRVSAEGQVADIRLRKTDLTDTYRGWQTDIPLPERGTLTGCVTCANDQLEYVWTDVRSDDFSAYRKKLEADGYTLLDENRIGENRFATYVKGTAFLHASFVPNGSAGMPAIRVITGVTNKAPYLPEPSSVRQEYVKITESKLTQMALDYQAGDYGMCYVVTLEDGSFLIVDGGANIGKTDHTRLWNLLKQLNERPDGKIVIAAWLLTHNHADHYQVFEDFCAEYGSQVTIEQFVCNVPDSIVAYNSTDPGTHYQNGFSKSSLAAGGIRNIKPYAGMKWSVRNVELEVLFTQADLYPKKLTLYNDSSMAFRMTVAGQTMLWLGDIQTNASDVICAMYGENLKSDMVQVSHHGGNGATEQLYTLIRPTVAFWPCDRANYQGYIRHFPASDLLANRLGVKENIVADPDHTLTFPFLS